MIQFQFYDSSLVFETKEHFKKLETKLRERHNKPKHVIIVNGVENKRFAQWNIVYNPKTQEFQDLEFARKLHVSDEDAIGILFDSQRNKFLYYDNSGIYDCDSQSLKYRTMTSTFYSVTWYYSKQEKKRFMIIMLSNGKVELLDWDSHKPKVFKTMVFKESTKYHQYANSSEEEEELLTWSQGSVHLWCLKTFTLKKTFITQGTNIHRACFIGKDLIALLYSGIEIRNKKTGKRLCVNDQTCDYRSESLIYCSELDLIITSGGGICVKLWKLNESKLKLVNEISSPFECNFIKMKFLDPDTQRRVLCVDRNGDLFIVDLTLGKVTWKKQYPYFCDNPDIIIQ